MPDFLTNSTFWTCASALATFAAAAVALWVGREPRKIAARMSGEMQLRAANAVQAICTPALGALKRLVDEADPGKQPSPFFPTKLAGRAIEEIDEGLLVLKRFDSHWQHLSGKQLTQLLAIERSMDECRDKIEERNRTGGAHPENMERYKKNFAKLQEQTLNLAALLDAIESR